MRTKQFVLLMPIMLLLGNWSNDQTTVDADGLKKNRVNFYGTLHTYNGETYSIENISIGRMYKQIPVYEAPNSIEQKLTTDPKKGIITKLDLQEIQKICVQHPSKAFFFKKPDGSRKTEYVIIDVHQGNEKNSYLIDTHRKLICDQISPSGPIEKEVPFKSLTCINIDGHKDREQSPAPTKIQNCGCDSKSNKNNT